MFDALCWAPRWAFKFTYILLFLVMGAACGRTTKESIDPASLSIITVKTLDSDAYDRFELELKSTEPNFRFPVKSFTKDAGDIQIKIVAGTYTVRLDYFMKDVLIFSADYCKDGDNNKQQSFARGSVEAQINLCDKNGKVIFTGNAKKSGASFRLQDGVLYDLKGNAFVMRGINVPFAYYADRSFQSLELVKSLGFNTVRIVWCADNLLIYSDRCASKDVHPVADLEKILDKMRQLKMVAVLNLQNATGSMKRADLKLLGDYLLKDDVKTLLVANQDMLLLNLANEWYGDWDTSPEFVNAYKEVIGKLRKAGLAHTLIVDVKGYGQNFKSLSLDGPALLEFDKNLMLSVHMYDLFEDIELVKASFKSAREAKYPFIIGEFSCSHGDRGTVACDTIMDQAENTGYKIGTIAWSLSGNGANLLDLNVVDPSDWKTLTPFGRKIVDSFNGVKSTSKEACFFSASPCP